MTQLKFCQKFSDRIINFLITHFLFVNEIVFYVRLMLKPDLLNIVYFILSNTIYYDDINFKYSIFLWSYFPLVLILEIEGKQLFQKRLQHWLDKTWVRVEMGWDESIRSLNTQAWFVQNLVQIGLLAHRPHRTSRVDYEFSLSL